MTRAAIYCRVSSDKQERDGSSLDTQLASCRAYAAEHGFTVVAEFQETYPGTVFDGRPELDAVRDLARKDKIDVVLVHALDRLSRIKDHRTVLIYELGKRGASFFSVTEPEANGNSLSGKIVQSVLGLVAEAEGIYRKERTERGIRARAEEKRRPISASLPYGYRWADPEARQKSRMVIYEPEAEIVRRIFQWLIGGGTATALMNTLNAEGVPTPRPKPGGLNSWAVITLTRIIRNEAYTGRAWAYKSQSLYEGNKRTRLPNRPIEERVPLPAGTIPRIIDDETFHKAAERLARNRKESVRRNQHPESFLLRSGFGKCFHCGGTLETNYFTTGQLYYRCTPAQRRKHGCPTYSIRAEELDAAVWGWVKIVLENPAYIETHAKQQAESDHTADDIDTTERALRGLTQQAENLARALATVSHPAAQAPLLRELESNAEQIENVQKRRRELLGLQAAHDKVRALMAGLSDVCEKRWAEIENLTYAEKRDILADLGVVVTLYPKDAPQRWIIDMSIDLDNWIREDDAAMQDILATGNGYGEWSLGRTEPNGYLKRWDGSTAYHRSRPGGSRCRECAGAGPDRG